MIDKNTIDAISKLSLRKNHCYQIHDVLVIDVASDSVKKGGIIVADGKVKDIGDHLFAPQEGLESFSGCGMMMAPGLIDLYAGGRVNGIDDAKGLVKAALAGGITSLTLKCENSDIKNIQIAPAFVEKNTINDLGTLSAKGVKLFYEEDAVSNARLLADWLKYSQDFGASLLVGAEENNLVKKGILSDGILSSLKGIASRPAYAELVQVSRDLEILSVNGGNVMFGPISYYRALDRIINFTKTPASEANCWAGIAPHHLLLNDENISLDSAKYICKPPLRGRKVVDALVKYMAEHLQNASNVCIMSGHSYRKRDDLRNPLMQTKFGSNNIKGFLPALLMAGRLLGLSIPNALALASLRPAEFLKIKSGKLAKGRAADLIIFDPKADADLQGTVFSNLDAKGRLCLSLINGRPAFRN